MSAKKRPAKKKMSAQGIKKVRPMRRNEQVCVDCKKVKNVLDTIAPKDNDTGGWICKACVRAVEKTAGIKTPPKPQPAVKRVKVFAVEPKVGAAFDRWLQGEPLAALATELGFKLYQNLRHQFIKLAGSKEEFLTLRAAGAGGTADANKKVGVKRTDENGVTMPALDDSKVPRWTDGFPTKSNGWRVRNEYKPVSVFIKGVGNVPWRECVATVHITPEGKEYVAARSRERADLLVPNSMNPSEPFRMRLFDTSADRKAITKEEKILEQGQEAAAAKKKDKAKHAAKLAKVGT